MSLNLNQWIGRLISVCLVALVTFTVAYAGMNRLERQQDGPKKVLDLGSIVIYPDEINPADTRDAVEFLAARSDWQCSFYGQGLPGARLRCNQALAQLDAGFVGVGWEQQRDEWCPEVERLVDLTEFWCTLELLRSNL